MRACRVWIAKTLRSVASWVDPSRAPLVLVPHDALYRAAVTLTAAVATRHSSGEHKRHTVYAQLMKDFPQHSHRACALAIEAALQER